MNIPLQYTMQQCDQVTIENATMPYMKSLYSCLNRMVGSGYTDNFQPTSKGLQSKKTDRLYPPKDVRIVDFFRFEGNANPEDNVILYVIETADGAKGTLVNGYGTHNENTFASLLLLSNESVK